MIPSLQLLMLVLGKAYGTKVSQFQHEFTHNSHQMNIICHYLF